MASAIDDCPVRVLVSLKRDWSSPLEAFGVAERWRIGAIKRKVYKERGQFTRCNFATDKDRLLFFFFIQQVESNVWAMELLTND